jgi:hypothetical protein
MKAVGDLAGLRRALPDALGVKTRAVAAHDLDLGPPLEPIRGLFSRAGRQHVGDGSPLEIDDDRSIGRVLAPAPVVDGDGPERKRVGALTNMAFQLAQDRAVADRHGEPRQQPLTRQTSCSVCEQPDDLYDPDGAARHGSSDRRQAFHEGAGFVV